MQKEQMTAFWRRFLRATERPPDLPLPEAFHFAQEQALADALLSLVLAGQKRATTSCLRAYEVEGDALPQAGDWAIVTDFAGTPRCVIETTAVTVLPFGDMTYEICRREGEDDTLASWRQNHLSSFTAEGKELGYAFGEDTPVVFEDFEMIYSACE